MPVYWNCLPDRLRQQRTITVLFTILFIITITILLTTTSTAIIIRNDKNKSIWRRMTISPSSPKGKEKADGALFSGFHGGRQQVRAMDIEQEGGPAAGENVPWVEKYRPSVLDEVVHHGDIIATRTALLGECIDYVEGQ